MKKMLSFLFQILKVPFYCVLMAKQQIALALLVVFLAVGQALDNVVRLVKTSRTEVEQTELVQTLAKVHAV